MLHGAVWACSWPWSSCDGILGPTLSLTVMLQQGLTLSLHISLSRPLAGQHDHSEVAFHLLILQSLLHSVAGMGRC